MSGTPRQTPRYLACQWCGQPMPVGKRAHARYCKDSCRVRAARQRRRGALPAENRNPRPLIASSRPAA